MANIFLLYIPHKLKSITMMGLMANIYLQYIPQLNSINMNDLMGHISYTMYPCYLFVILFIYLFQYIYIG